MPKKNPKEQLEKALLEQKSDAFVRVNDFFALLTVISVLGIIFETVESLEPYSVLFQVLEYTTVFFFTVEYIARLYVAEKKWKYIFSFYGLVDLIAILPTFFGLANLTFLKSARLLRILRFLRMMRLAKVIRARSGRNKKRLSKEEKRAYLYRLNVEIYFAALITCIVIGGTLMYLLEGSRPEFADIPTSMLWATQMLMGITYIVPETTLGNMHAVFVRFLGMGLFGLLLTVVGSTVKRFLFGVEDFEK